MNGSILNTMCLFYTDLSVQFQVRNIFQVFQDFMTNNRGSFILYLEYPTKSPIRLYRFGHILFPSL
jgi:hypothetical protein